MPKLVNIGVFSFAKFAAEFLGIVGFILGFAFTMSSGSPFIEIPLTKEIAYGVAVPLVMLVLLPIVYAAFGFVLGCIFAVLFNIVSAAFGGIKFEIENDPPKPQAIGIVKPGQGKQG